MRHCCADMAVHLTTGVAIFYTGYAREHSIGYTGSAAVQVIHFCPWCGSRLPDRLRDPWGEALEAVGIVDPFGEDRARVPAEFWTGDWWLARGL